MRLYCNRGKILFIYLFILSFYLFFMERHSQREKSKTCNFWVSLIAYSANLKSICPIWSLCKKASKPGEICITASSTSMVVLSEVGAALEWWLMLMMFKQRASWKSSSQKQSAPHLANGWSLFSFHFLWRCQFLHTSSVLSPAQVILTNTNPNLYYLRHYQLMLILVINSTLGLLPPANSIL